MTRIVQMEDHEPLTLDPKKMDKAVTICRCGLSADWPMCDNSHKKTRDEEDGVTYGYERDAPTGDLRRHVVEDPPSVNPRPS